MGRLLQMIPKNLLAFLAIVGGIGFIILSNPPHTLCDSQIEVINQSQHLFLFPDPNHKQIKTTEYEKLRDHCKLTNNPGGCYELFHAMKALLHDLGTLTNECGPVVGSINEYKRALTETSELMVRLAWGEKAPSAPNAKFGWLDTADISFFCQLKDRYTRFYGDQAWENFRERMMRELPGAKDLPRNQVWDLILFSENCAHYP